MSREPWMAPATAPRDRGEKCGLMSDALALMLAGAVGSDLLLVHLIGICPALAISRKLETAAGLAVLNIVVAPLAGLLGYYLLALLPATAAGLALALPIIVVSIVVCLYFVASVGERVWRKGHDSLTPFVPLMTVNCTLLGVVLLALLDPTSGRATTRTRTLRKSPESNPRWRRGACPARRRERRTS